ncbi:MAG: hypothetical protein GY802_08125, partial [Gammaproteobacteria bacterium]|nr:hypothetical protein [Gammaproteobacteria bacterium]
MNQAKGRPAIQIEKNLPDLHPLARAIAACLRPRRASVACTLGLGLSLLAAAPLQAATYTVTNTNNAGLGSLRNAVKKANANPGADEILFESSATGTLLLAGQLTVTDPV